MRDGQKKGRAEMHRHVAQPGLAFQRKRRVIWKITGASAAQSNQYGISQTNICRSVGGFEKIST
jgi:hypothetical protein